MGVYRRYKRKRVKPGDKDYSKGTWYIWKRIKGQKKPLHEPIYGVSTKAEAEEKAQEIIQEAREGHRRGTRSADTVSGFADTTYRRYVNQKNTNIKAKEADIDVFIKHFGPDWLLRRVTPQDCRDLQDKLLKTPTVIGDERSPSTVNRTMSSLSKMFTLACEEGLLDRSPMEFVRGLIEPPARKRLLDPDQKAKFWHEVLKDRFMYQIVMLAVNLPVRRGQILGIQKEHCHDLHNRILWVIPSKNRPPRPVPVNDAAFEILTGLCREVDAGHLIRYQGRPIKDFRTRWEKLLVRAKINKVDGTRAENFHFHDLRTEFASNLLGEDVNPEVIRQLFAHSTMQITQGYTKAELGLLYDAVSRLRYDVLESQTLQ
jgi:integrase